MKFLLLTFFLFSCAYPHGSLKNKLLEKKIAALEDLIVEHEEYISQDIGHKSENHDNHISHKGRMDGFDTQSLVGQIITGILFLLNAAYFQKRMKKS